MIIPTIEAQNPKNVLGSNLESCCTNPMTGFLRDGYCRTVTQDQGTHVVCAVMTQEFLDYTKERGNDLTTPKPEWSFPGLKPDDRWCLCILRWLEAVEAGVAPKIILKSTDDSALKHTSLELLRSYKAD